MTNSGVIDRWSAHQNLLRGAATLADAVRATLGPHGRCVLIERPGRPPVISDDGLTIARAIVPANRVQGLGARALRESAERTARAVGDGTATAILLAYDMLVIGAHQIAAGAVPIEVKHGLDRAARAADQALSALTRCDVGLDALLAVATAAAGNDPDLGAVAADAAVRAGPGGTVRLRDASARGRAPRPAAGTDEHAVVLTIGAASGVTTGCRREGMRHAVASALMALRGGILPGAGVGLVRVIPAVEAEADRYPRDERAGALLLARALEGPAYQLAENAGVDGAVVVRRVRAGTGSFGFDAVTGRFADLLERGVIDASFVVRAALANAVAVAGALLLADTMVVTHSEGTSSRRERMAAARAGFRVNQETRRG